MLGFNNSYFKLNTVSKQDAIVWNYQRNRSIKTRPDATAYISMHVV